MHSKYRRRQEYVGGEPATPRLLVAVVNRALPCFAPLSQERQQHDMTIIVRLRGTGGGHIKIKTSFTRPRPKIKPTYSFVSFRLSNIRRPSSVDCAARRITCIWRYCVRAADDFDCAPMTTHWYTRILDIFASNFSLFQMRVYPLHTVGTRSCWLLGEYR